MTFPKWSSWSPTKRYGRSYQFLAFSTWVTIGWKRRINRNIEEANRIQELVASKRQQPTLSSSDQEELFQAAFINITAEPKERAGGKGHLSLPNEPSAATSRPPNPRKHQPTTTTIATFSSHKSEHKYVLIESWSLCVRLLVVRTWRVDTSIMGASQLYRTVLVAEAVMKSMYLVVLTKLQYIRRQSQKELFCEGSNSDSTVTTEVGVGVWTRQLQDLLSSIITNVRTDFVTMTN